MDPAAIKALGPLAGGLFALVDELFTSEAERADARLQVLKLLSAEKVAQMAVNTQEAGSKSTFVAGWRPFIGWVCGMALAWQFVLLPIIVAVLSTVAAYNQVDIDTSSLFEFDLSTMMPVLLGMLGLGTMRSFEKSKGVASDTM